MCSQRLIDTLQAHRLYNVMHFRSNRFFISLALHFNRMAVWCFYKVIHICSSFTVEHVSIINFTSIQIEATRMFGNRLFISANKNLHLSY